VDFRDYSIHILVADDDSQIRRCCNRAFSHGAIAGWQKVLDLMSAELFGNSGQMDAPVFKLVQCSQGEQALSAAEDADAEGNSFDVVFLDIRMPPGLNGVEVAKTIRTIDPDVPIVFVSAYSDVSEEELRRQVQPSSRIRFYKKPLNFRTLALDVTRKVCEMRGASESRVESLPSQNDRRQRRNASGLSSLTSSPTCAESRSSLI